MVIGEKKGCTSKWPFMVCFLFHWQDECLVFPVVPMPLSLVSLCCDCMSRPDWLHLVRVNLSFLLLVVLVVYIPTCTLCPLYFIPVVCWTVSLPRHCTSYSELDISWNINIIISSKKKTHYSCILFSTPAHVGLFLYLQQLQSCDNKGLPEWLRSAKSNNYKDKHKHTLYMRVCGCAYVCPPVYRIVLPTRTVQ